MDRIFSIISITIVMLLLSYWCIRKFILHNADFWMAMNLILAERGKYKQAIKCCDRTVKLYPFYVHAWNNKGFSLYQLGEYDDALKCFDEALILNPQFTEGWHNKGLVLQKLGRSEEAGEAFLKAEALSHGNVMQ